MAAWIYWQNGGYYCDELKLQTKAYIYEQQEGNKQRSLLTSFGETKGEATHILT